MRLFDPSEKDIVYLSFREWLNPKDSEHSGWCSSHIKASHWGVGFEYKLSDCVRNISMDLDIWLDKDTDRKKEIERVVNKAKLMIEPLQFFIDNIEKIYDSAETLY